MRLTRIGTVPVSGINLGLGAAVLGLQAEIAKLAIQAGELPLALSLQAALQATPFDPSGFAAAVAAHVGGGLAASVVPGTFTVASVSTVARLTGKLALVELQIAAVKTITAAIGAGFSAGGIAGWSYAGRGQGFGTQLQSILPAGFGSVRGDDDVAALVVATEDFSAWGNFSASFNTGASSGQNLGSTTERESLAFLGELSGGDWNTGVRRFRLRVELLLSELEGLRIGLLLSLAFALGASLPGLNIDGALAIAADLDLDAVLPNFNIDIDGQIEGFNLRIQLVLELIADLQAQLSGGGLSLWFYTGSLSGLGSAMATELAEGLPGGSGPSTPSYGLALACASPSAWADFGLITKNAA